MTAVVINTPVADLDPAVSVTGTEKIYADTGAADVSVTLNQIRAFANTGKQDADDDLTALAQLESTGLLVRTGDGAAGTVSIVAPAAGITVANGDGVSGSPTLALANDLAGLEALSTTGLAKRTGDGTWTAGVPAVADLPVKDEDNMASNSDAHVPTQQSVKAYVDAEATTRAAADSTLTTNLATEVTNRTNADLLKVSHVADRTALAALSSTVNAAYLREAGREGLFKWSSSNLAASVTIDTAQGIYVAPTTDTTGASGAWVRALPDQKVISPRWFGVTFAGSGDDLTAWNAVAAFMNAGLANVLLLPGGSSWVSDAINPFTGLGFSIFGRGQTATEIRRTSGTSGKILQFGSASTQAQQWRLTGLRLQNSNSPSSDTAIDAHSSADGFIDNVITAGGWGAVTAGSTADGTVSSRLKISNCKFVADATLGGTTIDWQSSTGLQVINVHFSATGAAGASFKGLHIHPSVDDTADASIFVACEWNYPSSDPATTIVIDATNKVIGSQRFIGCVMDQAVNGKNVHIFVGSVHETAACAGVITFDGCTSNASTGSNCVYIDNQSSSSYIHVLINGCNFTSLDAHAVKIAAGNPVDVIVSNSTFLSRKVSGTASKCVYIADGASGVSLLGNIVRDRTDTTGAAQVPYTHFLEFAGDASNITVIGNRCNRVTTGLISGGSISEANRASVIISNNTAPDVTPTYAGIPQLSKSADYTLALKDANTRILHPSSDNNARTFTIPANSSVAYPIDTTITFINKINTLTIAITSDTLTLAGPGSTGSRTLAANGIATALKISSTEWLISGTGLS